MSRIGAILGRLGALLGRHGGHWKGWDVMEGVQTVQEASKTDYDARKTAQERSKRIRRRARSARTGLKRLANGPKHPQEAVRITSRSQNRFMHFRETYTFSIVPVCVLDVWDGLKNQPKRLRRLP